MAQLTPRVHYELEPWQLDESGQGGDFAFPVEARADTLARLSADFRPIISRYGHVASYFVNRITSTRLTTIPGADAVTQPGIAYVDISTARSPRVGEQVGQYVLRDAVTDVEIGRYDRFFDASAAAQDRARIAGAVTIDFVVTERIALLGGPGREAWSYDLLESEQGVHITAAALAELGCRLHPPRPERSL